MIYVMMVDGSHREVPAAYEAAVEDEKVVCYDRQGHVVATFPSGDVSAYGSNEALKEQSLAETERE